LTGRLFAPREDIIASIAVPLRLFLVLVLVRPSGPPLLRSLIVAAAAALLVSNAVLARPIAWVVLTGLLVVRLGAEWPMPDNHQYLEAYFGAAIALSLLAVRSPAVLARASRLLIGAAFAFACLWKVGLSRDFVDGRFFRVTLLTDHRFDDVVRVVGSLDEAMVRENRMYLRPLPEGDALSEEIRLHEPLALRVLAFVATWGIVVLEGGVAFAFLWPGERSRRLRHLALLAFCVLTYAVAPVAGFGWLLLSMGLTDVPPEERGLQRAYAVALLLVLLFTELDWSAMASAE